MQKVDAEMNDELRPEYDLRSLRVRKVGSKRKGFKGQSIQLEPDVAAVFACPEIQNPNESTKR